jgi:hypothetical protein
VSKKNRATNWRSQQQQTPRNFKWYPTAADLQLPQVPAALRDQIRVRLAPWLADLRDYDGNRLAVEARECWKTAQCLTLTASDSGVKYVEGVVYGGRAGEPLDWAKYQEHGWTTVDGHIVDLTTERLRVTGEYIATYDYEALNVFTDAEIRKFYAGPPLTIRKKGGDLSAPLSDYWRDISPEPEETTEQLIYRIYARVFSPAQERLRARLTTARKCYESVATAK